MAVRIKCIPGVPGLGDHLARVHAQAFETGWSAAAFDTLIDQPGVKIWAAENADSSSPETDTKLQGFALVRTTGEECEILTIAVLPQAQRTGIGRHLMQSVISEAQARNLQVVLEVSSENRGAKLLYQGLGFSVAGKRPGYYLEKSGDRIDALILKWKPGDS